MFIIIIIIILCLQAKYDSMQANIRNMEDAQRIAELETEVSEYKLKVNFIYSKTIFMILFDYILA